MTDATESPITCDLCDTPIPIPADAADDFVITCPGCGRQHGTWGEFKVAAFDLAKQAGLAAFKGSNK